MDYIDTLLGAAIAWGFFILGKMSAWKGDYREARIEAVCGCKHHRSFHKDDGKCNHDDYGAPNGWIHKTCGCQNYRGPKPFSQVMDEEIESS